MKAYLPVLFLLLFAACNNQSKITSEKMDLNQLEGTWELNYITGPRIAFDGLYPGRKPTMNFLVKDKKVSGFAGCNTYSGPFTLDGFNVDFNGPITSTKMACEGQGETVFFNTLRKVTRYAIPDSSSNNSLSLLMGDVEMMRLRRIPNP
ncbi:MAG: META domain-containing protein [Chitinophagaceae bacterium]|nr:MAG: META domain-containing protein [Chitinophagaceae bacterium]